MIKRITNCILLLLCINVKVFSQDIQSNSPIVLPLSGQTTYTVGAGQTVNIKSAVSVVLSPGVTLSSGANVLVSVNQSSGISYASPQVYTVGTTIPPLMPTITSGIFGTQVSAFAGSGSTGSLDGTGLSASFNHPAEMAIDANNNIYLADELNNKIRKITPSGTVTTFAGSGTQSSIDGTGISASFYYPAGIVIDPTSTYLYVSDYGSNVIRKINIATQQVTTIAGSGVTGGADGQGTAASFNTPLGLAVDGTGNIYVADYTGNKIRKISTSGYVSTLAGSGSQGISDGLGNLASFDFPSSLRVDANGNIIVVDRGSDLIRKITPAGLVSTLVGNAFSENSNDGSGTSAEFFRPSDLVFDNSGNLYITDYNSNKIRKLSPSGALTTLAGTGIAGNNNGAAITATFNGPFGISIDGLGNLFVSDIVNNAIRKIIIQQYSISPALPQGLTFDPITGTISGTPTQASPATDYTVTIGNNTITLNITVNSGIPTNPVDDANKNWIVTRSFDESGNEIAATKQFFDNNGKPTQLQSQNESANNVLASQTIYDLQGRAVINTLPAPINNTIFGYNGSFVTSNNSNYNYLNFDGDPSNTVNPNAKLNNPDPVDNTQPGSLGWYYSDNNTLEPYVGTTSYPYSRVDFYHDGTGAAKRSAGIGEQLKMGAGHETTSNSFPVQNELNNYLAIRNQFFPSAVVGNSPTSLAGQVLQSVSVDQNGTGVLSVTDLSGKMSLMAGRADPNGWLPVTNTLNLSNIKPIYSFTTTNSTGFPINSLTISSSQPVDVFCTTCSTGSICVHCPVYSGTGNNYSYSGTGNEIFQITSEYPFTVTETLTEIPLQNPIVAIYDQAEAQYVEPTGSSIQYFQLANPSTVNITCDLAIGNYTLYNMTTETDITQSFTSGSTLPAGYYKVIANPSNNNSSTNNVTVSYTNKYADISYNYYNQLGQLIASIAPSGVRNLLQNGTGLYTSAGQLPFVTLYQYDVQGRLVSTTTPDGGSSKYVYRQDGKIRFSQNAAQSNATNAGAGNAEKFSYTNYDSQGRPIESGEYAVSTAVFAGLSTNVTILEATDATGGLTGGTKLNQINTYYDLPATNLTLSGYTQDAGFLKGAVSYTTNANSTTWYNYDDHGRLSWVVKQINGLGTKTIDYIYNDQGNVAIVDYQKGTAAERFIHYYDYDADGRLTNVQTSQDDISKLQQAKYTYYLHGPLKRTELGEQLQGVDYVYTPQGWLKSINTSTGDLTKDPHKDGVSNGFTPDAFGMQLEYFPNDYTRTSSNINSITTGQINHYDGNVNGLSWQSNKPSSLVSTVPGIQNPAMYIYGYDSKYQLSSAIYGSPDFNAANFASSSAYNEKNISYDANGNIIGLQRTNSTGVLTDDFSNYQYAVGTNKLSSVGNTGNPAAYANYTYDELGRLKSQQSANGNSFYLQYDVTGKVTGMYADAALTQLKVSYSYDESGNRISRTDNTGSQPITTYYVYDAAGNAIAIYTGTNLAEMPFYGSERLGTYNVASNSYVYELRDNVGSVRVVLNRAKNSDGTANIVQYNDYYPYGSIAQNGGSGYRYDYQGAYSEKDPVTGFNNFELRMYDGRIGRWLSTDPAGQFSSPYEGMGNNPVVGSDPTGGYDTWLGAFFGSLFGIRGSVYQNQQMDNANYQQYYYASNSTSVGSNGEMNVISSVPHYGDGSQTYQMINNVTNNIARQDYESHLKLGDYNEYTGYTRGSGAVSSPIIDPIDFAGGFVSGGLKGFAASTVRESEALTGIQLNKMAGDAFRDELADAFRGAGRNVETEVFKRTPFGARYIDIQVSDGEAVLGGIETKVGNSRYTPLQRIKDIWLGVNEGYHVQLIRKP